MNRALTLIAENPAKGRGRAAAKALKEMGPHPEDGEPVVVLDGRFGPYVKHGKINASLPKGKAAADLEMAEAVELPGSASRQGRRRQGQRQGCSQAQGREQQGGQRQRRPAPGQGQAGAKSSGSGKAAAKAKPAKSSGSKATADGGS